MVGRLLLVAGLCSIAACGRARYEVQDAAAGPDAALDAPGVDAPVRDAARPDAPGADALATDAGADALTPRDAGPDAPLGPNRPPVATSTHVTNAVWPAEMGFVVSDPDLDPVSVVILRRPEHGSLGPPPGWLYDPTPGFRGIDSIVFAAFDGRAYSQIAELHIAVTGLPDARGLPLSPSPVTACGTLSTGDYVLANDIVVAGDCFFVDSPGVTLVGAGHTLTGDGTGIGIRTASAAGVRIFDLTVSRFDQGIHVRDSPDAEIGGVTFRNIVDISLWVEGASDGASIQSVVFEDVGTGLFVAGGAHRATMVGITATRVRDSVSHFYDESRDNFVIDGTYDSVGRAVSCDRCHDLKVLGIRASRATIGIHFVYNCRGHHLAAIALDAPVVGMQTMHWGGCGDALLSDISMTGAIDREVRFDSGTAHGPFVFLNPSWTDTREENLSGSTSTRDRHVVVRAVDATGAPVAGRSLELNGAGTRRTPFTTDSAGLSRLITLTESSDVAGVRMPAGPYRVVEGTTELLADVPLDRSVVDVVVP